MAVAKRAGALPAFCFPDRADRAIQLFELTAQIDNAQNAGG
jgi:hypothetical protein